MDNLVWVPPPVKAPFDIKTVTKNGGVSTIFALDSEKYETAVCKFNGDVHVVEEYFLVDQAKAGHEKWVKKVEDGFSCDEDLVHNEYRSSEKLLDILNEQANGKSSI